MAGLRPWLLLCSWLCTRIWHQRTQSVSDLPSIITPGLGQAHQDAAAGHRCCMQRGTVHHGPGRPFPLLCPARQYWGTAKAMHGEGRRQIGGAEKIPSLHSSTSLAFLSPCPIGAACQLPPDGSVATLAPLSPWAASACVFALELIHAGACSAGLQSWQQHPWTENLAGGLRALAVPLASPPRSWDPSLACSCGAASPHPASGLLPAAPGGESTIKKQPVALCLHKRDPLAGPCTPCFSHP